jgi:hypothetical protein
VLLSIDEEAWRCTEDEIQSGNFFHVHFDLKKGEQITGGRSRFCMSEKQAADLRSSEAPVGSVASEQFSSSAIRLYVLHNV